MENIEYIPEKEVDYEAYSLFKDVLNEELIKAIPEFLNQGLLITNVQEAVHE